MLTAVSLFDSAIAPLGSRRLQPQLVPALGDRRLQLRLSRRRRSLKHSPS
jgi:hypothetical protein